MKARLAELFTDHRNVLAMLSVMLVVGLACGARYLQFETSYRIFFGDDNPQLMAHDEIQDTYTKSDNVMFVFDLADKQVFTRETLQLLLDFTKEAWQLPYSSRVDSITNYQYSWAKDDDLIVEDFIVNPLELSDQQLAERRRLALEEPQLVNLLVSDRAHVTAVLVTLQLPDEQQEADKATLKITQQARELAAEYEADNANVSKIHMIGETIVSATFNEMSRQDAQGLFPLMLVLIVIFLVVMLRSLSAMVVTMVIIALSVAGTLGFAGWSGYALNQVNVMCPIIVLTLAVCNCVHLLNSYLAHLSKGLEKIAALQKSLESNMQALLLTSITTAVGFLSMNFSDSPPFWGLGNISAFGVMLAFVCSLTLLPALVGWLPFNVRIRPQAAELRIVRLAKLVIAQQNKLFLCLLATAIVLVSLMWRNQLNDDTAKYFHEDVPFRQAADFTEKHLTGFDQIAYSLNSQQSNGVTEPEFLKQAERFVQWLAEQPEVVQISSYVDIHKRLNKNLHNDDEAYFRIPDDRELSAQFMLLYELSLPFGLDLNNQIDIDKSSLLIRVRVKDQKAKGLIALDERVMSWMNKNTPELTTHGASVPLMFAHIGSRNIDSMIAGSLMALGLVTLILIIALKSFKYGLISIIPNAFPAGMAFGIWALIDGEVNLAVAVIFAITLGIVVDDTVHFISKYRHGVLHLRYAPEQAVVFAFEQVGRALVATTVVLAAGFFVLSASDFAVNSVLGLLVAITIVIALIWDLLFLPVLLMKVDNFGSRGGLTLPLANSIDNN